MTVEITSAKHLCKACKQPKSCNCSDEVELLLFKEKEPEPKEKKQDLSSLSLAFWNLIEMDYDNFLEKDKAQLRMAIYHILFQLLKEDQTYKDYMRTNIEVTYTIKSSFLKSIVLEYLDKWALRNE